ncbi:MAG: fumarylacetoacetate hydrolase family protein [Desulfocurvibacter africanus]
MRHVVKSWLSSAASSRSCCNSATWTDASSAFRISKVMTLQPGDVVLTGTPEGVGPLRHGDEVRVEIEGVGILINRVVAEKAGESEKETPMQ